METELLKHPIFNYIFKHTCSCGHVFYEVDTCFMRWTLRSPAHVLGVVRVTPKLGDFPRRGFHWKKDDQREYKIRGGLNESHS